MSAQQKLPPIGTLVMFVKSELTFGEVPGLRGFLRKLETLLLPVVLKKRSGSKRGGVWKYKHLDANAYINGVQTEAGTLGIVVAHMHTQKHADPVAVVLFNEQTLAVKPAFLQTVK
ncbi:MAG: hypothetical protein WC761_02255 [Candidatus Paceibacterota bacterium]|jgi:hypothetical protein